MSGSSSFVDYYDLLEVDYTASTTEIRSSYLRLAKLIHPDTGGSTEKMQLLNSAYKTLTDENKRAAYNKMYNLGYSKSDELDLREEEHGPKNTSETGLEDDYVDQLYKEYYQTKKSKKKWFKSFGVFTGVAIAGLGLSVLVLTILGRPHNPSGTAAKSIIGVIRPNEQVAERTSNDYLPQRTGQSDVESAPHQENHFN